jgi:uncharacterized membrane protein
MEAYVVDWLNLLVRWLHLIAGIAWIGASFYFVMLDSSLVPPARPEDAKRGVFGELWAVHGGGFYVSQKFPTGPKGEPLTENLHWSKWEAYTTWLSGMALLALIYWLGAGTYLIDGTVMPLSTAAAIAISIGALVAGWLVYDGLCRALEGREALLAALLFAFVMGSAWALFHLFSARAAYLHVGAMIGTMMVGNVFFHIIPGQKRTVADIRAGHAPDPRPGIVGKQRSVHNTYFTLPVLFVMISNHYPMTYGHPRAWLVLVCLLLLAAYVRHFFNLRHRGRTVWVIPAIAAVGALALAVAIAPERRSGSDDVSFRDIKAIVDARCVACHAEKPRQEGIAVAPKGVVLESPAQIAQNAAAIRQQAVASHAMPLGNLTNMTDDERARLGAWIDAGARVEQ